MNIRRTSITVVIAAGLAIAATSCASGTASGSAGTKPATAASTKTYTAADLPPILTKAEKSLGVSGTVLDNTQVQAEIKKLGGGSALTKLLSQPGSSISPASCKSLITSALSSAPPAKTIASILTYGTNTVSLASEPGKQLPASVGTHSTDRLQKLLSSCSSLKLTVAANGQSETVGITLKKVDLTTNADKTAGIEETLTMPSTAGGAGKPISLEVVDAIDGNLLITANAASTATTAAATTPSSSTPSLTQVINAVVAAAK